MPPPVHLNMQHLSASQGEASSSGRVSLAPITLAAALEELTVVRQELASLAELLDQALYLDEEEFGKARKVEAYTTVILGQQRKVAQLERALREALAQLADSERRRVVAEERVAELATELDNSKVVMRLHSEELLRRDQEVHELETVVKALSLVPGPHELRQQQQRPHAGSDWDTWQPPP